MAFKSCGELGALGYRITPTWTKVGTNIVNEDLCSQSNKTSQQQQQLRKRFTPHLYLQSYKETPLFLRQLLSKLKKISTHTFIFSCFIATVCYILFSLIGKIMLLKLQTYLNNI